MQQVTRKALGAGINLTCVTTPKFKRAVLRAMLVLPLGGEIWFKTDNDPLFEWSIEEIPQFGFELSEVTRDLHANGQRGVMTDYEAKFYAEGKNINRCVATMQPWEEPEEEDTPEEADETAE